MSPLELKTVFERKFNRDKDDPEEWGTTAWNLMTGAEILFKAHAEAWAPDGEPINPENERLNSPATMLYGYAIENAIKGFLIKKHGGFEAARTVYADAWQKHHLLKLAVATGLPLDLEQKALLQTLEAFVRWAGKYPISQRLCEYTIGRQFQCEGRLTPSQINASGIAILSPFYNRLKSEIFADISAAGSSVGAKS